MRHSTAPVRVSILVISLRLRNETIRLPSLSRSSELPCIQLTLGPVRLAGAKSVISKWSNGFHWNNSSPTELTCWTTVPITCAFATPPSPERSMVRVSSHMIQYAPSGSAIRSWKRGGRPPTGSEADGIAEHGLVAPVRHEPQDVTAVGKQAEHGDQDGVARQGHGRRGAVER